MGTFAIALFIFLFILLLFFENFPKKLATLDAIFAIFSLLAFISCVRIYIKIPKRFPAEKKGYLFLMISILLFFLGDLFWFILEVFFQDFVPLGGLPDISWNLAYFSLMISLYFFISFSFRESNKLYYFFLSIAALIIIIIEVIEIKEGLYTEAISFIHIINELYVFYDIFLIIMIFYLVWPMIKLKNKIFYSWIILLIGLVFRVIYDYIFVILSYKNLYSTGNPIDLIYVLFYLAIIFSNIYKCQTLDNVGGENND